MRALDGIRVIDFSRVLAGPYCTMLLADHGADVIKIEKVGKGDDSRSYPPIINGESGYFANINRGKRSVILNLYSEKGREIALELVKKADVIVENFRPGTMEKIGLGYEYLKELNPRLIYGSVSGYGHTGPWVHKPAYDIIIQALSGFMSITGDKNSVPTKTGSSIMDILSGIYLFSGIVTALYSRERTGVGQKVDIGMLDCAASILENAFMRYEMTGEIPSRTGNRHTAITPFESFTASDGMFVLACGNDSLFFKLCDLLGRDDIKYDDRFKNNELRTKYNVELSNVLNTIFKEKKISEWCDILESSGIPVSKINSIKDAYENVQLNSREMFVDVIHPKIGKMKTTGIPIKLDQTPGAILKASPILGEDTEDVLRNILEKSDEDILFIMKAMR